MAECFLTQKHKLKSKVGATLAAVGRGEGLGPTLAPSLEEPQWAPPRPRAGSLGLTVKATELGHN